MICFMHSSGSVDEKRKMTAIQLDCSANPQSHIEVADLVVAVTMQSTLGAHPHGHATEHLKRLVPTIGQGPSRPN